MPEGDTVWRTAHHLREVLAGRELIRTDFRVPAFATVDLTGTMVDEVVSCGKHLLIRAGEHSIHTHLKMEGSWHVYRLGSTWQRPAHSARIILETADHQAVGFSLGITEVLARAEEAGAVGHLGPDLLGSDWDLDEATRRLAVDPSRATFLALHDQRNLAGFGNVYANELCFLTGVLPTRPVAEIGDITRMVERGRTMIQANRDRVERTFTGSTRRGGLHWVFGRDGRPCRRCGATILRGTLGDSPVAQRNTFWCPRCQT